MKKIVTTLLIAIIFIVTIGNVSAFAAAADADTDGASGGWSESKGYYVNQKSEEIVVRGLKISSYATGVPKDTPNKHTGKRLTEIINSGGDVKIATLGETVWYYKYHYTTARVELSNGTVKTTSGRRWGQNATIATSPWYLPNLFENIEARTYWGS